MPAAVQTSAVAGHYGRAAVDDRYDDAAYISDDAYNAFCELVPVKPVDVNSPNYNPVYGVDETDLYKAIADQRAGVRFIPLEEFKDNIRKAIERGAMWNKRADTR